jgi:hypothetical protein
MHPGGVGTHDPGGAGHHTNTHTKEKLNTFASAPQIWLCDPAVRVALLFLLNLTIVCALKYCTILKVKKLRLGEPDKVPQPLLCLTSTLFCCIPPPLTKKL